MWDTIANLDFKLSFTMSFYAIQLHSRPVPEFRPDLVLVSKIPGVAGHAVWPPPPREPVRGGSSDGLAGSRRATASASNIKMRPPWMMQAMLGVTISTKIMNCVARSFCMMPWRANSPTRPRSSPISSTSRWMTYPQRSMEAWTVPHPGPAEHEMIE